MLCVVEKMNKGIKYEEKIYEICLKKNLIYPNTKNAGAGNQSDITLKHKGKKLKVEVKSYGADYGQKIMHYKNKKWVWGKPDRITDLYDYMGVFKEITPSFIPKNANHKNLDNWSQIKKKQISFAEKKFDQSNFEKNNIPCNKEILFDYYAIRDCYYIQIDKSGFYHMKKDIFNLGTDQFDGEVSLRLRAKSIHNHDPKTSKPTPWWYSFYAVMKLSKSPKLSKYDLDSSSNRQFPKIL